MRISLCKRLTAAALSVALVFAACYAVGVFMPNTAYADTTALNVVLDPGHGGSDYGATSVGGLEYQEKGLTFKLGQYILYELRKYDGVSINMTRYADYHMTSVERAEYAERVGADVVISLHFNQSENSSVHGASVCASGLWEYTKPDLGYSILSELAEIGIDTSAGVYTQASATGNMWWDGERLADFSATMRECAYRDIADISVDYCYLTCYDDLVYYSTDYAVRRLAVATANGIASEYGLTRKSSESTVERTQDEAYMSGYDDGTFRPSGTITRAECATMLARLSDSYDPNTVYETTLADVPTWAWYYNYVAFLNSVGFVTGDVYGNYRPDDNMTKAEFAILVCRYLGLQESGASGFSDCEGHMADGYIAALRENGYVGGDENGEFHPNEDMIRSSVVMMMNRVLGRYPVCTTEKENPFSDIDSSHWAYENILEACVTHEVRQ